MGKPLASSSNGFVDENQVNIFGFSHRKFDFDEGAKMKV